MTSEASSSWKVQGVRMGAGAVVGAAAVALFFLFAGRFGPDRSDPGAMLAVIAGLSYGLIGLFVGVGALAPQTGARFLNVEDAEDLREQRRSLGPGAIVCILAGLLLLVLASAPSIAAASASGTVELTAGALLAVLVAVSLATRGRSDELMKQVSLEASSLTLNVSLVVLTGWVALAGAGRAGAPSPLAMLAGVALLELAAIFWVSARRGMVRWR